MSFNNFLIEVENSRKYPELFEEDAEAQAEIKVNSPDELRTKFVSLIKKIPFLGKLADKADKIMQDFQGKAESIVKGSESSEPADAKMEAFVRDLESSNDQIMEAYVVGKKAYLIHEERGFLTFEMQKAYLFEEDYQETDLITGQRLFIESGTYLFEEEGELYLLNEGVWDKIKSGAKSVRNLYFGDPEAKGTIKGGKVRVGQSILPQNPVMVTSKSFVVSDPNAKVKSQGVIKVDDEAMAKSVGEILNFYVMKKTKLSPQEKETVTPIDSLKAGKSFVFSYAAGPEGKNVDVAQAVQKKLFDVDAFAKVKSEIDTQRARKEKVASQGGKESFVMKILRDIVDKVKSQTRREELIRSLAGGAIKRIIGTATPIIIGLFGALGITLPIAGTFLSAILTIFGSCVVTHLINKYILHLDIPFWRVVLVAFTLAAASYGIGKAIKKIREWWGGDAKTVAADAKVIADKNAPETKTKPSWLGTESRPLTDKETAAVEKMAKSAGVDSKEAVKFAQQLKDEGRMGAFDTNATNRQKFRDLLDFNRDKGLLHKPEDIVSGAGAVLKNLSSDQVENVKEIAKSSGIDEKAALRYAQHLASGTKLNGMDFDLNNSDFKRSFGRMMNILNRGGRLLTWASNYSPQGRINISDLAKEFGVTQDQVIKDAEELARRGWTIDLNNLDPDAKVTLGQLITSK